FLGSGRCLKKSLRFGVRERATNRRFCPKGEGQVYGPSPPPGAGGGAKKGADNSDRRDRTKWYSPSDEILALYGVNLQMAKSPCQQAQSPQTEGEIATALPEYIPEYIPPISPWRETRGRPGGR